MPERTPGGLFLVDAATRDELLQPVARPPMANPQPAPTFTPGQRFAVRLASEYFVTDPERWLVELHDADLVVSLDPITAIDALVPELEACAAEARSIAIGAPSISPDVVAFLVVNKLRGTLSCAAFEIDAPAALVGVPRVRRLVVSPTELSIGGAP